MLAIWSLVPLLFLNPAWTSGSCTVDAQLGEFSAILCQHVRWAQLCGSLNFGIAFLWDWNENLPFQSCGHWCEWVSEVTQLCLTLCDPMDCSLPCSSIHETSQARILEWVAISFSRRSSRPKDLTWVSRTVGRCFTIWAAREVGHCWVFQICWHTECSTFTTSFREWNGSTGIPSPPLVLLVVMLPKTHLTSHFRMSDSRWVITPSWLSGSWRSFLYSSFVYSCHLFLISSASVQSLWSLSFIVLIFAQDIPLVPLIFLRSLVFSVLLFSSISLHWSLRKAFLSLLAVLGALHSDGYIFPFFL